LSSWKFGAISAAALHSDDTLRVGMWKLGRDAFLAHPVLGQGPGSGFRGEIPPAEPGGETRIITGSHAHNMFIDVLAHTGLAGFLGFLALHLAPLGLLWPHRRSPDPETFFWVWAALAVNLQLFLNGLTDQVFGLKPMMYIHWTVTAAALWQTREARQKANNP
jgi:O-antigen ligase